MADNFPTGPEGTPSGSAPPPVPCYHSPELVSQCDQVAKAHNNAIGMEYPMRPGRSEENSQQRPSGQGAVTQADPPARATGKARGGDGGGYKKPARGDSGRGNGY